VVSHVPISGSNPPITVMASTDVTLVYQLAAAKCGSGIENRGPEKRSEDPKLATSGPGDRQPPDW
jgi:hypothetical protein